MLVLKNLENHRLDDGSLLVIFDRHGLRPGTLSVKREYARPAEKMAAKFEQTMPQAYCCRAYNFSGKEYHV